MIVRVSPEAELDLIEIELKYLRENPFLPDEFLREFYDYLDIIGKNPELSARVTGDYRRFLMKRFPYYIIYEMLLSKIVIVHLVHDKRHPSFRTKRIK